MEEFVEKKEDVVEAYLSMFNNMFPLSLTTLCLYLLSSLISVEYQGYPRGSSQGYQSYFSQIGSSFYGFPKPWNCSQILPTYRPHIPIQPNDMLTKTSNTFVNTNSPWLLNYGASYQCNKKAHKIFSSVFHMKVLITFL